MGVLVTKIRSNNGDYQESIIPKKVSMYNRVMFLSPSSSSQMKENSSLGCLYKSKVGKATSIVEVLASRRMRVFPLVNRLFIIVGNGCSAVYQLTRGGPLKPVKNLNLNEVVFQCGMLTKDEYFILHGNELEVRSIFNHSLIRKGKADTNKFFGSSYYVPTFYDKFPIWNDMLINKKRHKLRFMNMYNYSVEEVFDSDKPIPIESLCLDKKNGVLYYIQNFKLLSYDLIRKVIKEEVDLKKESLSGVLNPKYVAYMEFLTSTKKNEVGYILMYSPNVANFVVWSVKKRELVLTYETSSPVYSISEFEEGKAVAVTKKMIGVVDIDKSSLNGKIIQTKTKIRSCFVSPNQFSFKFNNEEDTKEFLVKKEEYPKSFRIQFYESTKVLVIDEKMKNNLNADTIYNLDKEDNSEILVLPSIVKQVRRFRNLLNEGVFFDEFPNSMIPTLKILIKWIHGYDPKDEIQKRQNSCIWEVINNLRKFFPDQKHLISYIWTIAVKYRRGPIVSMIKNDELDFESLEFDRKKVVNNHLSKLFGDKLTSNMIITAGGKRFFCHREIVASNWDYFKALLRNKRRFSESNKSMEYLEENSKIIEAALKYSYTGKVSWRNSMEMNELLVLADKYFIMNLKKTIYIAERRLRTSTKVQ